MMISVKQYSDFLIDYYKQEEDWLRLGQTFVNQFLPGSGEETADIFYESDDKKAAQMIYERYVKC